MREEYQNDLKYLRYRLGEVGFHQFFEEITSADFVLFNRWTLRFVGERVGAGGTLLVVPPNANTSAHPGFALWILMRVFEAATGRNYGPPTLEGQIDFLIQESAAVFENPPSYQLAYDKLNSDYE